MREDDHTPHTQASTGPLTWMVRNPIAANLLMILLIGGGIWTTTHIQKEVFPDFDLDVVTIRVNYPGASPAEVEQGIILPIEEAAKSIQGISDMSSLASEGSGRVTIELVSGTPRMKAFQDIDQAVNRIRTFPDDIDPPQVTLQSNVRDVMEVGLYGDVDVWTLRKLAEQLRDELRSHPNISQVDLKRVPDYVIHVEVSRKALREHDLTLARIAAIIEDYSEDIPAGSLETAGGEILLRVKERRLTAREFENIPLITSERGTPLTLGDIATLTDGFEEAGFHSQFNQQPSVEVEVFRIGNQSPIDIADAVESVLAANESLLPPGVNVRIDSNRAKEFRDRLTLLLKNGVMAIVIVLCILSLFLEFRLAFWVMMGMATSFIGGILILPLVGVSINMISMFAFLVVLGIVVDDAIVVGENIYEHRKRGLSPIDAAIKGVKEVSMPVTFSILTSIVAFIPLMFMPGTNGKFWWTLPVVVIVMLAVSLFEALLILPAHVGHAGKASKKGLGGRLHNVQQRFADAFNHFVNTRYRAFLDSCLRFRYVTLCSAITLLIVVGSYSFSDHMGMILMPRVAAHEIEAGVRLPVGTTPENAARIAKEITDATRRMFDKYDLDRVAEGIKTNVRRGNFIDVEIVMKPPNERDMTAAEVITLWRDEIGDIEGVDQIGFEAERGPGGWRDDISVDISHNNVDILEKASMAFKEQMESFTATRDVNDNFNRGKSQLNFHLRPEARNIGLTAEEVGRQVRGAFYGELAVRHLRGIDEVEVRVKLPKDQREKLYDLEDFMIRTPNGTDVPFLDVVDLKESEAFTSIERRNGRRIVTVGMDVEPQRDTSRVIKAINKDVLPDLKRDYPGITWTFEGNNAQMRESTKKLWGGFALAMAIVYSLLAVAFGSYTQPLIVMFAIPFGVIGAVIGHIILGFDLSIVSMMGVIALSGVVVNDSLIMVDYANRRAQEMTPFQAIHEAGLRRFRPIILTTITTAGGLMPIILETSTQAAYLIPMAISLGFGIVFATAIILVIVPCLYLILQDITKG